MPGADASPRLSRLVDRHPLAVAAGLALLYFAAARLSLLLAFEGSNASPVWPPTGIAIAALLLGGLRLWPAIALGAFAANLASFHSGHGELGVPYWIASATIALGNSAEAALGAWLLRRGSWPPFRSQRNVFRFIAAILGATVLSAGIGTASLVLAEIVPPDIAQTVAWTWWLGDVCGGLLLVPVIVAWAEHDWSAWRPRAIQAEAALAVALGGAAFIVFGGVITDHAAARPWTFLLFPLLSLAALRYSLRGATSCTLVVATLAVWGTTHAHGPFAGGPLNDSLVLLDSFLALCAAIALVLAADRAERIEQELALAGSTQSAPWLALLTALGVTILGWHLVSGQIEQNARERFLTLTRQITWTIDDRLNDYERLLRGGGGLFAASKEVERAEWREFVAYQNIRQKLQGIQGFGFVAHVSAAEKFSLEQRVQREGFPGFAVKPPGERTEYAPIIYLEPFDERNQRAFGLDLMSEPVRRAALEAARDSGRAALTGKIQLVQEDGKDIQPGLLLVLPVYRHGAAVDTVEARRAALSGYVYSPFRTRDLMLSILGHSWPEVALDVYAGRSTQADALLYADAGKGAAAGSDAFERSETFDPFGQVWTLRFRPTPQFEAGIDRQKGLLVFIAGALVSLLLFAMARAQALTGAKAAALAQKMTRELAASQARYRELYEASPAMLHSIDAEGRLLFVSDAWLATLGYTREEVLGRRSVEFLTAESRDHVLQVELPRLFQAGRNDGVALQMLRKDGQRRDVLLSAILERDQEGRPERALAFIEDITERKRTEAERSRLLAIAEQSPDFIGTADMQGHLGYHNQAALRMVGLPLDTDLSTLHIADMHPPWAAQRVLEDALPIVLRDGVWQGENALLHRDGHEIPVSQVLMVHRDAGGAPSYLSTVMRDMSEQRRAAQALALAKEAAEAASRAKSEFLANMSHEIRTPMNGVIGMAQLLATTPLDAEQQGYLAILRSSAEGLLGVINDILDLSKVEAGKLDLAVAPFQPRALLRDTCELFAAQAQAKGVAVHCEIAAEVPPWLAGDAGRLRQVLTNLLGNALKFTERGSVGVTASHETLADGSGRLRIAVRDSGIGMAAETVAGLFAPFYQADASTTRRFGGTGLGLSISKRLVELMGGSIKAESTLGSGSCFSFWLPLPTVAATAAAPHSPGLPRPARVLVADDNATNRQVALAMLERLGIEAVAAANGEEAIELLRQQPIDLILLDCQMPTLDGYQATRRIRAGAAGDDKRALPIVAMTASDLDDDLAACQTAGMDGYLSKPLVIETLLQTLRQWLPGHGAGGAATRILDEAALLANSADDREIARMVATSIQDDLPRYLTELEQAVAAADYDNASRAAHSVKGLLLQAGAGELAGRCRELEQALRSGAAAAPLAELHRDCLILVKELDAWRRQ
ncbi:MAG TPA: CHASE domain-containing protein [Rhodocyclaceae bacterium]